jgi:hypothetical protein
MQLCAPPNRVACLNQQHNLAQPLKVALASSEMMVTSSTSVHCLCQEVESVYAPNFMRISGGTHNYK